MTKTMADGNEKAEEKVKLKDIEKLMLEKQKTERRTHKNG